MEKDSGDEPKPICRKKRVPEMTGRDRDENVEM